MGQSYKNGIKTTNKKKDFFSRKKNGIIYILISKKTEIR
jgi:hypothetical protein